MATHTDITIYIKRFADALGILCTERPPEDMCHQYLSDENQHLQQWVVDRLKFPWFTGIGAIEASWHLVENCIEEAATNGTFATLETRLDDVDKEKALKEFNQFLFDLDSLMGEYWDIAYTEGSTKVNQSDRANKVLHELHLLKKQFRLLFK